MRIVLCGTLMLFQLVMPCLCHEHDADPAQPTSEHGLHLHTHYHLFWPIDHDDDQDCDNDHDADAIYLPAGVFVSIAPRSASELLVFSAFCLIVSWSESHPLLPAPDPVALSPPLGSQQFVGLPIYLATLILRI